MLLCIAYEHHVSPSEAVIKHIGGLESKQHISVTPGQATLSSGIKERLVLVEIQDFSCQCISTTIDHSPRWT